MLRTFSQTSMTRVIKVQVDWKVIFVQYYIVQKRPEEAQQIYNSCQQGFTSGSISQSLRSSDIISVGLVSILGMSLVGAGGGAVKDPGGWLRAGTYLTCETCLFMIVSKMEISHLSDSNFLSSHDGDW